MKHTYNLHNAMKEVLDIVAAQPADPFGKITALVAAVTLATDAKHRAILRMRPVLAEEMLAALDTSLDMLYVLLSGDAANEAIYQPYIAAAVAAQNALNLPASVDCGMRFVAYKDGKEFMARIDVDGRIVGKRVAGLYDEEGIAHLSGEGWANHYAIPRSTVFAVVEDAGTDVDTGDGAQADSDVAPGMTDVSPMPVTNPTFVAV